MIIICNLIATVAINSPNWWNFLDNIFVLTAYIHDCMCMYGCTDTAYFVFGENISTFTTNDPTHKEFIKAGLDFVEQVGQLQPLPIYKYFPTKAYKTYVQATSHMRELGMLTSNLEIPLHIMSIAFAHTVTWDLL